MNFLTSQEIIDTARPYLEIETSMLLSIRNGIKRLIKEAEESDAGFSALVRIAAYSGQMQDIDRELAFRN
jgi:hypothetical protein